MRRDGHAELAEIVARIRAIPKLTERAAPEAARNVKAELDRQIAAGTTAEGEAWKPREVDGGQPLRNAAKAVHVAAVGTTIVARVKGPEARHHKGRAKGGVERPILPTKGLPRPFARAIKAALVEEFEASTKGGR